MKSRVIVINNLKIKIILLITIIFIYIFTIFNFNNKNLNNYTIEECSNIKLKHEQDNNLYSIKYKQNQIDFPKEVQGVKVIGKLEISEINLITYILAETSKENLNKSVTKLYGPKVNGVGNLCITGHNYHKERMFGNLNKLEIGDKIKITDMKGCTVEYKVYDIYKVYPKETGCLAQETAGEREVTLITCTTGAIKRLIVKAREIYD